MHPQPGTAAYDKVIHRDLETNCTWISGVCQLTASEARGGGGGPQRIPVSFSQSRCGNQAGRHVDDHALLASNSSFDRL